MAENTTNGLKADTGADDEAKRRHKSTKSDDDSEDHLKGADAKVKKLNPAFVKLQRTSKERLTSKSKQPFVKTHLVKQAEEKLHQRGSVVISGKPGEGMTLTGCTILTDLFNIDKCIVIRQPREWYAVDVDYTDAIFIDDIFGIYQQDAGMLTHWMQCLDKITSYVEQGKLKTIISTTTENLQQASSKVSKFSIFNNVVEFSSDKLSDEEKAQMLSLSLAQHNRILSPEKIHKCVTQFASPLGFPFCCHLFSTNETLFKLEEQFFIDPLKFKGSLTKLDKVMFASLVFLFYKKGTLPVSELTNKRKEQAYCEVLSEITTSLDIVQTLHPSTVKRNLENMTGVYVTSSFNTFRFLHNSIHETVGLLYGNSNPGFVLRTCNSDFLHQCIVVGPNGGLKVPDHANASSSSFTDVLRAADVSPSQKVPQDENRNRESRKMVVSDGLYPELAHRLITEVTDCNHVVRTAGHPAFLLQEFVRVFVQVIKSKKSKKFFKVYEHDWSGPIQPHFLPEYIQHCCRNKDPNTVANASLLISCIGKCKHYISYSRKVCWKCKLKYKCLSVACWHGDLSLFQVLLQYKAVPDAETVCCAARGGNEAIFNAVKDHGLISDVNTLNYAARGGNIEIFRTVLEGGAKPTTETVNSAAKGGNVDIVSELLESGVVPNKWAAYSAIGGGDINIVTAVLDHSRKPNMGILNWAVMKGNVDIVKTVLKHGAKPNTGILTKAVMEGNADIIKALLHRGLLPDRLVLDSAVKKGNVDIVRAVIEHGGAPDAHTVNLAVKHGDVEIAGAVIERTKELGTWHCQKVQGTLQLDKTTKGADIPKLVEVEQAELPTNGEYWCQFYDSSEENITSVLEALDYGETEGDMFDQLTDYLQNHRSEEPVVTLVTFTLPFQKVLFAVIAKIKAIVEIMVQTLSGKISPTYSFNPLLRDAKELFMIPVDVLNALLVDDNEESDS